MRKGFGIRTGHFALFGGKLAVLLGNEVAAVVAGGFILSFFADIGLAVFLSMLDGLIQRHENPPFVLNLPGRCSGGDRKIQRDLLLGVQDHFYGVHRTRFSVHKNNTCRYGNSESDLQIPSGCR